MTEESRVSVTTVFETSLSYTTKDGERNVKGAMFGSFDETRQSAT